MSERLTWNEIVEQYPNKWVGLKDVIWEDADSEHPANVKSGRVVYSSSNMNDVSKESVRKYNGKLIKRHTDYSVFSLQNMVSWYA